MAGHSKWANIKHRKSAQDAKRAKIFQKLSKEIIISMKSGGNNLETNAKLRLAVEKAKTNNMPSDNIKKLLEKGNKDQSNWEEVIYEGYGFNGVAIIVETLTDNINRTSPQIKSIFSKYNGNLGTTGSVSYLFKTIGLLVIDEKYITLEKVMEYLLETNVKDIRKEEDVIIIESEPKDLILIKEILESKNIVNFIKAEISKVADQHIELNDVEYEKIEKLIEALEDNDDVQNVYTNIK